MGILRAGLVAGLCLVASGASAAPPLHDTDVVLHETLIRGTEASAYVAVSAAETLDVAKPVAGATVQLSLEVKKPEAKHRLVEGTTGADGTATLRFRVPDIDPGAYELVVVTRSPHGEDTLRRAVVVEQPIVLHLRTDRPVYKAGQTLRWRVTMLGGADAHPRAGETVDVEIRDPRGTALWRGQVKTDAAGMSSGEVPLADDLASGKYSVRARAHSAQETETVEVRDFVMPPFAVAIEIDGKPPFDPGTRVQGRVVATYPYGEPVAGTVALDAGGKKTTGKLDANGRFAFEASTRVEGGSLAIVADVTDGAGRVRRADEHVPSKADRLAMAVIPDREQLTAGKIHEFTILTTDGDGSFVPTRVYVRFSGLPGRRIEKASDGAVKVALRLHGYATALRVEVGAVAADGRVAREELRLDVRPERSLVKLNERIIGAGRRIQIGGHWPKPTGRVLAILLRRGAPVATVPATVDAEGKLSATLPVPEGVFGLASVRVVEATWDRKLGTLVDRQETTTVYVVPARLAVVIEGVLRHKPGADAKLSVTVRDAAGKPAAGVGLAASVVDERVLALGERRPDLVEVLGASDVKRVQQAGILFADLLGKTETRARLAQAALLTELPPDRSDPFVYMDASERFKKERERILAMEEKLYPVLLHEPALGARQADGKWVWRPTFASLLATAKWKESERPTPWGTETEWSYVQRLQPTFTFDHYDGQIASERLDALAVRLRKLGARALLFKKGTAGLAELAKKKRLEAWMVTDPWVTPIQVQVERIGDTDVITLVSLGPDQTLGTKDDLELEDVFAQLGGTGSGYGIGGGRGGMRGRTASVPNVAIGSPSGTPGSAAALRERFDETVLWATGVRTDAAGRATLEVPLADSITGWEVAVEAVAAGGAVGVAKTRLETFLPIHIDTDLPHRLTVGDEFDLPIVVANHSGQDRQFTVTAKLGGAVEAIGKTTLEVSVPNAATRSLVLPIRGARPGSGQVELRLASGSQEFDAMRRSFPVEAPGALVRTAQALDDPKRIPFTVPASIAEGSFGGRLRVFRGVVDQALDGLEDLIQEPYGCFEQTSSSTYPNLLVLDLLKSHPNAGRIRQVALGYVARGYQRLISFEVKGGGFSWFGEEPANQALTAYGLVEFVDMARVYPVDPELIDRTRKWLVGKQQGDGSWKPDEAFLHDWSAVHSRLATTAFIAWALAESGSKGKALDRALGYLRGRSGELAKNPYLLALWAAAESAGGKSPAAPLQALARFQRNDAFGAQGATLFFARGRAADVQITALAAIALYRSGGAARADKAVAWLWNARDGYGWGSTQGTVLALRAAALAASRKKPPTGKVAVKLDGKAIGTLDLGAVDVPTVTLPASLAGGSHELTIDGTTKELAADLRLGWREAGEAKPVTAGLKVQMTGPKEPVAAGGRAKIEVTVTNASKKNVSMPMVVVPVPPGFRPVPKSLKEVKLARKVSRVEDVGTEVRFYLRELAPQYVIEIEFEWEAVNGARVMQRPAVAYAYYDPEIRGASAPLRLEALPPPR